MNILHISDIHFCMEYRKAGTEYEKMLHRMQSPRIPLEFCLKQAQRQYPADLLVITGDLTDGGSSGDYRMLRKIITDTVGEKLPVLVTPGNHDIRANMRVGWFGQDGKDEPLHQVYDAEELSVLALDSSEQGKPDGRIGEEQMEWLEKELEKRKDQSVILMTHHHLDTNQAAIPAVKPEKEFLELLHRYHPVCILNGHTHHAAQGRIAGVPYYTSAGMSFCGDNLEDGRVCFEERYGYNWYCVKKRMVKKAVTEVFFDGKGLGTIRY